MPKTSLLSVPGGLNTWLRKQEAEIVRALPRHIDPDYFIRAVLTAAKRDNYLMEADPISFLAAVFEAAQAGLVIDSILGHAYLVSFMSKKRGVRLVQLIPGYKGLMEMARRSGQIAKIEARIVRPDDAFSYAYGLEQELRHTPGGSVEGDAWTHVYAIAWFTNGAAPQFEVMRYSDVMRVRDAFSSSVGSGRKSPWDTSEHSMAKKTVVRRLTTMLPLATLDQRLVSKDEAFDAGFREAEFEVAPPSALGIDELASDEEDAPVDTSSPDSLAGDNHDEDVGDGGADEGEDPPDWMP